MNQMKDFITEDVTSSLSCSKNLHNLLVCHQALCHTFISKNWCVGEKLKFIILRSQFGQNIYNIQTWITNTNSTEKDVFTHSQLHKHEEDAE